MNTLKTCTKCKQIKPVSAFGTDRITKSGLQSWCWSCKAGWARQHYQSRKRQTDKQVLLNACKDGLVMLARLVDMVGIELPDETWDEEREAIHTMQEAIKQVV